MSFRVFFLISFLCSISVFAGDEGKEVTELCGINSDSSQWFSLALVKILADSAGTEGDYVFHHHNGKKTVISYDSRNKVYAVKKNFKSEPADSSLAKTIKDPLTQKALSVEWEASVSGDTVKTVDWIVDPVSGKRLPVYW